MGIFRNTTFGCMVALFAFFVFTGDLVADAICDADGQCVAAEKNRGSDHGKGACPICACAVHGGAVVMTNIVTVVFPMVSERVSFANADETAPPGEPAAIDHPPQLA